MWCLETVTSASKSAGGYMTAIWDCNGQGFRNLDPSLVTADDGIIATMKVRASVPCLGRGPRRPRGVCASCVVFFCFFFPSTSLACRHSQKYYPECLQLLLILNANFVFKCASVFQLFFSTERSRVGGRERGLHGCMHASGCCLLRPD